MSTSAGPEQPLRVAINAQFMPGRGVGGVESALIGLLKALAQLEDGPEQYTVIGPQQDPAWLKPYLGHNQVVVCPARPGTSSVAKLVRPIASVLRPTVAAVFPGVKRVWPEVPVSNGFYESLGCHVMHFPFQHFALCALPTVYNPHDLQHVHYPQFFNPATIAWRETIYRAGCHFSQTVIAGSQWVKDDIVEHYGVSPQKVQVIPWAPPTQAYPEPTHDTLMAVREKYRLEQSFALYPAMTWEHKNHIRLLEAIALLRDRHGLIVHLVCTGHKNDFWPRIEQRLLELGLSDQVRFLGVVPGEELRALYRLAQFVVIPSLFEAASGPLFEAWQEGAPVACSQIPAHAEQANLLGENLWLFDPLDPLDLAHAISQVLQDAEAAAGRAGRAANMVADVYSWERAVEGYLSVFHEVLEKDTIAWR